MRIVHLLHEFPYPPNSGIRCDMWRRLEAFHSLGHQVFAVSWASASAGEVPGPEPLAKLDAITADRELLVIGDDWRTRARRVGNLRSYPSYIAARMPPTQQRVALTERIRRFAPDLIWAEGVHTSGFARGLRSALSVPLAYRSHNIESRYVAEQARLASSLRLRLALFAGTWGLETAERAIHAEADRVFDISTDDLAFWRAQGFTNGAWLPTQPDPDILSPAFERSAAPDFDLLFLGSLSSPNNIAGLDWFANAVAPIIRAAIPDVRIAFAGRNPPPDLVELAARAGADLIANPPSAAAMFARAAVNMNPILHGSGVNIKTIDMLATGRRVVTTAKGARGLPAEIVAELSVGDTADAFAAEAIAAIHAARTGGGAKNRAGLINRLLGVQSVAHALKTCVKGVE